MAIGNTIEASMSKDLSERNTRFDIEYAQHARASRLDLRLVFFVGTFFDVPMYAGA